MTREQQQATRELERAQVNWLKAYGWQNATGPALAAPVRWSHPQAPKAKADYTTRDAVEMTRAQPGRYEGPRA